VIFFLFKNMPPVFSYAGAIKADNRNMVI
jgi:hypothetical protein